MSELIINYVMKGQQPTEGELVLKHEHEWSDQVGTEELANRINQCVSVIEGGQVTERFPGFERFTIAVLSFQQPPPEIMGKLDRATAMLKSRGIGFRLHLVLIDQPARSGIADLWRSFRSWLKPKKQSSEPASTQQ